LSEKTRTRSQFREYAEAIIIAVLLALFIRTFIVQAFKIPSGSMIETLQIGDHILVNKFLYGVKIPFTDLELFPIRKPHRLDIIVFKYPEDESKDFIKRVIGEPGDVVEVRDKTVYVNHQALVEPYVIHRDAMVLPAGAQSPRDNLGPLTVPPDSYFVMGDNRDQSLDSRFWGFVKREKIRGKAFMIYWSWDGPHTWVRWNRIGRLIS
jgi:signal peptidase I